MARSRRPLFAGLKALDSLHLVFRTPARAEVSVYGARDFTARGQRAYGASLGFEALRCLAIVSLRRHCAFPNKPAGTSVVHIL